MAYQPMSDRERMVFLASAPARPAILCTVRRDGRPHSAPVWYDLDGEVMVFTTGSRTVKGRNMSRDPRVTLCVDDDRPPFSFVTIEGVAELDDDPVEVRRWAARIGGRYMGEDRADEYGERNGVPLELVVRVTPVRFVTARNVAD